MKLLTAAEEITRCVFEGGCITRPNPKDSTVIKIKKKAVAPSRNENGEYETSVMMTSALPDEEITKLCRDHVAAKREKELTAHFSFSAETALKHGLHIHNDEWEHVRHCAIKGWPAPKEDMVERASDLAETISAHASLKIKEFL